MKNNCEEISNTDALWSLIGLYLLVAVIQFVCGLGVANSAYSGCYTKMSKIEYIFPAFQLACYLNKTPTE